ncbi:hypothetical protein [Candidatus Sororendozoicomonas aggregata]|uniref:hypothetical protein n=1 Tax=Candidatus Sororendozoicomonas aggregata TaxID=3073239 RepID=UPI002ED5D46A
MFNKSIQCASVTALSFILLCIVHTTTASAKVYSITPHGDGTKVTSKVSLDTWGEAVDIIKKLNITVPKYSPENYVEIKADVYTKIEDDGLKTGWDDRWFGFSIISLKHGGIFHREKFTLRIWCNGSGSEGFIVRKDVRRLFHEFYIVGGISCTKS